MKLKAVDNYQRNKSKSFVVAIVGLLLGFGCIYKTLSNYESTYQLDNEELKAAVKRKSDPLAAAVSILCWVVTSPKTHKTRAEHVKNTWGRDCNHLIFMSSQNDSHLGAVALPVSEGRDHLWAKTKESLNYLYKHHQFSADWFFKADDDTYAVMDNMRDLLKDLSAADPWYLGNRFHSKELGVYAGGGSGYIFSRKTLQMVVEKGLNDAEKCREDHDGYEDVEMGKCLANIGISMSDTRDARGGMRFLPYMPNVHADQEEMTTEDKKWFFQFTADDPVPKGMASCSPRAVTFHYVSPEEMYELDFLIYQIRLYGDESYLIR
uniref:N-acetylgalactosaminide beta-1,3-galactosyltransferase n=1 Tax=Strigamia maritima TaxID=126957 RepID=T1J8G4_STRMM